MPIREFHTGVRKNVIQPGEILVDIVFPAAGVSRNLHQVCTAKSTGDSFVNLAIYLSVQGEKSRNVRSPLEQSRRPSSTRQRLKHI